ncbi:MAG: hypothetical protein WCH52_06870 [Bacteroidota bacterium]
MIKNRKVFQAASLFIIFTFFLLQLKAQKNKPADTVKVGIYLKSLSEFNSNTFTYGADLWMWYSYKNDSLNPLNSVEIVNAKDFECSNQKIEKKGDIIWASQDCKAIINQNWDWENYPFDLQKVEIILEEEDLDIRKVFLTELKPVFEYGKQINIKGWKIDSSKISKGLSHYKTDFENPSLNGESLYPNVVYTLYLSRDSMALFFKLFTGCYVAFLVAFLVFFIKPIHVDPRFGLSIGALFAAVGNKYVVDSNMPESISFTLVDKIHDITFVYILISILCSIISLKLYESKHPLRYFKFDKIAGFFVFLSYFFINILMIFRAI